MTMDRRTVLKNLGVAGTVGALAGCVGVQEQSTEQPADDGSGSSESSGDSTAEEDSTPAGTAKAWYALSDTELPIREANIEAFNEASKHTIEGADIADMRKKTTSAIPAGQGPKTFEWAHDLAGGYLDRGFIVGKGDSLTVDLDAFTGTAAEAAQFDGNVVGLPHSAETVALVYNKDIVDEAPSTVAEMTATMEEYHDPDNNQYGLGMPFADAYFLSAWAHAFGGYYFDSTKEDQLGVDNPETVEGVQFAVDNFVPYMPNDPAYEPQASVFAEGNAAFAINGPWYLNTLNDKGVDYGVVELPTPEGGSPQPYTGITLWYFTKSMEEDGPATAAAQEFVEWFVTNEEIQQEAAQETGSIPVLQSVAESGDLPADVQGFADAVAQGYPMPADPKMNQVWTPVKDALTKSFNGNDVEQAMQTAAEEIRGNWE